MTIAVGHADVEEDSVRSSGRDRPRHIGAALQEAHVETLASKQDAERHHRVALVVRDHYANLVPQPEWRRIIAARKLRQVAYERFLIVQLISPRGTPLRRR